MRVEGGNVNRDESPFVPKKPAASNGQSHFRPTIRENINDVLPRRSSKAASVLSRRGGTGGHATATATATETETEHFRRRAEFTSLAYS